MVDFESERQNHKYLEFMCLELIDFVCQKGLLAMSDVEDETVAQSPEHALLTHLSTNCPSIYHAQLKKP